ncbi:hypothetical protein T492DRAFT_860947 [Pavlovales sp. CCMP2436]|nr:hypothetical protein T492DRAFT_860947 [Pavlovales sp. CCMP2436]
MQMRKQLSLVRQLAPEWADGPLVAGRAKPRAIIAALIATLVLAALPAAAIPAAISRCWPALNALLLDPGAPIYNRVKNIVRLELTLRVACAWLVGGGPLADRQDGIGSGIHVAAGVDGFGRSAAALALSFLPVLPPPE